MGYSPWGCEESTQLSDFHFHFQLKSWRGEGLVGPVLEVCLCWADTGHPQGKQALGPPPQHPARLTLGRPRSDTLQTQAQQPWLSAVVGLIRTELFFVGHFICTLQ